MSIANVLQPLIDACQWVLEFWHGVIGNGPNSWGWSIILLTFTVRILILPLTFKGVKGMQRLQTLQPEIKKIQARYKDDKQRMNQEVMAFYQREKVNPLSSCMPLLLQIPFFISLFYLLRSNAFKEDIAANPGFYPIDNLAEKVSGDPVLLGTLIVLYVGTQLAASAVTAFSADPMQRRIMFALPFVFVVFIINFQAGLIVYWITTNVWTIGQQLLVKKLYPKPVLDAEAQVDKAAPTPARGKPPSTVAAAADGGEGKAQPKEAKSKDGKAARKTATAPAGGGARTKAPPASPRKKKKRSGRRR
jgi:YidC/Oxa1 family membrane protein insertase